MPNKIDKKIKDCKVKTQEDQPKEQVLLKRDEVLHGSTYKIKAGQASKHAIYVTINDIEVDNITRPFEIFANTKDSTINTWLMPLTRMISAVFRHNSDISFVVDELKSISSPDGGWFSKGIFIPSVPAALGIIIEKHIGLTKPALTEQVKEVLAQKRKEFEQTHGESGEQYPPQATVCKDCGTKAVILMDGCLTCLECGSSKCGA